MNRSLFRGRLLMPIVSLLVLVPSTLLHAQTKALITARVDETNLTQLKGNVLPQLKTAKDLGEVDSSQPAGRLMLVLKRSDAQQAVLQSFLLQIHQQTSPKFHQWLAPGEYGKQFGAADSDIAQITGWMQSHGLKVVGASSGKNTIEFTGTVGQVKEAFHTSIHQYSIRGETHYANATNPKIPAAFNAVVAGITQLNDFRPRPMNVHGASSMRSSKNSGFHLSPETTVPGGGSGPNAYLIAPEDFAVQYDLKPVYAAGVTGKGQTIGIINDSNIDISVVNAYRKLFGLSNNPPQVVIDGSDPGIDYDGGGDAIEAYLDVENASAVAPDATVRLYTAGSFGVLGGGGGGLNFALARAVGDDTASVLSLSFGECEAFLGNSGNEGIYEEWAQAAAQGQTVLVSTGDSGSAGCDGADSAAASDGLQVNGLASTPWNMAVGGTDFYYADYATGGASIAGYWNSTNDSVQGSLLKPIPEQAWNETMYGLNSTTYTPYLGNDIAAGGGGASLCSNSTDVTQPDGSTSITCLGGYAKPSWQTGAGTVADGVRDLPDVSLFAADLSNGVAWIACVRPDECVQDNTGDYAFQPIGGTSASAPAMAGVMALVNQKYGPQGQANYVLYPLAAQFPAAIKAVDFGTNNVPCVAGSFDCQADTAQLSSLDNYSTTAGYDQATGLGSLDVNQLITNWGSVVTKASATTLSITPTTISHGQNVNVTTVVTGTGTPSGNVALVTSSPLPNSRGITAIPLDATGQGQEIVDFLPGGTYTVTGQYGGDGINGPSKSQPVTLTVSPETSSTTFTMQVYNRMNGALTPVVPGTTYGYGTDFYLDTLTVGDSGAPATGTMTFLDGTSTIQVVPLSAAGTAELIFTGQFQLGAHSISVNYAGDASYNASKAGPVAFTTGPTYSFVQFNDPAPGFPQDPETNIISYPSGGTPTLNFLVTSGTFAIFPPTGTMTFTLSNGTSQTVNVTPENTGSFANAILPNLPDGTYTVSANYNGDSDYASSFKNVTFTIGTLPGLPSITTLALTSATPILSGGSYTVSGTVQGTTGGPTPTGTVLITQFGLIEIGAVNLVPGQGNMSTFSFTYPEASSYSGNVNPTFAVYQGDANYAQSASGAVAVTVPLGVDFTINMLTPSLVVKAGASGTATVSLSPQLPSPSGAYPGTVQLTCQAPAALLCSISATGPISVPGQVTETITIQTVVPVASASAQASHEKSWKSNLTPIMAFCFICFLGLGTGRRRMRPAALMLMLTMVLGGSSGCSHSAGTPPSIPVPPTQPTMTAPVGTYAITVTATSDTGVVHNTVLTVYVQ